MGRQQKTTRAQIAHALNGHCASNFSWEPPSQLSGLMSIFFHPHHINYQPMVTLLAQYPYYTWSRYFGIIYVTDEVIPVNTWGVAGAMLMVVFQEPFQALAYNQRFRFITNSGSVMYVYSIFFMKLLFISNIFVQFIRSIAELSISLCSYSLGDTTQFQEKISFLFFLNIITSDMSRVNKISLRI